MKIYSLAGYSIIVLYLLGCAYFAPAYWGPWPGTLVGGAYLIFCWFLGGLCLAGGLHLGIAHRSLGHKQWFIKAGPVVNSCFGIYVGPLARGNRQRLQHNPA